jgi:hypothetical protein
MVKRISKNEQVYTKAKVSELLGVDTRTIELQPAQVIPDTR